MTVLVSAPDRRDVYDLAAKLDIDLDAARRIIVDAMVAERFGLLRNPGPEWSQRSIDRVRRRAQFYAKRGDADG